MCFLTYSLFALVVEYTRKIIRNILLTITMKMYHYSKPAPLSHNTKSGLLLTSQTSPLGGRVQGDYLVLDCVSQS